MFPNLPSILPVSGVGKRPSSIPSTHAQDFSVHKLQQTKDLENAKVSMNQVISQSKGSGPTTSIAHGANDLRPVSSVAHIGEVRAEDNDLYNEEVDNARFNYAQRLMMAKKAKQEREAIIKQVKVEKEAQKVSPSVYEKVKIGTGAFFKTTGWNGLKRQFYRLRKKNPEAYKNLSDKDQKYYLGMVKKYAKSVAVGKGFDRQARRHMRYGMEMDRRKGIVSKQDIEDFDKLIHSLPNSR